MAGKIQAPVFAYLKHDLNFQTPGISRKSGLDRFPTNHLVICTHFSRVFLNFHCLSCGCGTSFSFDVIGKSRGKLIGP